MKKVTPASLRRTLLLIIGGGALFAAGMLTYRSDLPPVPQLRALWGLASAPTAAQHLDSLGRFRRLPAERRSAGDLSWDQVEEIRRLEAIGYVAGSTPAVARTGVTRFDPARAHDGLNLYTDGHAPEATLIDMEGNVLHRWSHSFSDAFPASGVPEHDPNLGFWRRIALTETGDLLAIHEGLGLIKLDPQSNLVWAHRGKFHHDLEIQPDGTLYVLTQEAEMIPRLNETRPILHDFIVVLDAEGRELRSVSILEAIESSDYPAMMDRLAKGGDILHTNTIEVLKRGWEDRSPAFRKGNVLVSWPVLDTIGIIDMDGGRLVWALSNLWRFQHQPTLLDDGRILLFDNRGDAGKSRILEFDPFSQEIVWSYRGSETGFFSPTCGSNQRLGNGNTLITETDYGRAFEVTPGGEIVWEFYTPHRAGENGEYIASLFEMLRLPAGFPIPWASGEPGSQGPL